MALATNAHLAYVQVSSSPLVQIIAFDLAVVLLSFSCIYIVLHAAYAILEQTVLGESRKPREEKMRELDQIFKKYKYSIPEDEMDEFQKDFANFARRRGYLMNGSLLPGGPSAEDDLAIAPLASVDGDVPLAAKTPRVVETPERPITPPPLPMFAAVISPGASSFVSLSHTSPAGNLTKAPVHIQPLARKAYTPAHTLEAIAAQEGVSEPLTSRIALPRVSLAEQSLAATSNGTGTYDLGTGLVPGETLLGTTIPPPIPPLRQPSSSSGIADEFASNAPLLRNDPLLVEGDALFGEVAPLVKADTPVDDVADPLAEGELAMPFAASGSFEERQISIPPNASLTRMSPTADPTRDIGIEQALNLPPMADSTLSLPADSTASRTASKSASRRRAGSIATRPALGAASSRSAPGTATAPPPASTSSISVQELFLGLFGTDASEEGEEEHGHRVNALNAQVDGAAAQPVTSSDQNDITSAQSGTTAGQAKRPSTKAVEASAHDESLSTTPDVHTAAESDAPATAEGDATAALEDNTASSPKSDTPATSEPDVPASSSLPHTADESPVEDAARDEVGGPSHDGAAETSSEAAAGPTSQDADSRETATEATDHKPDERTGQSPENPIVVSPDNDTSLSLFEGDITITQDDASSPLADDQSALPADGRSVLPANGPRSAFDDSDEEEDEDDDEEEEDIVDASTLHNLNGTLSPIAEGFDEEEEPAEDSLAQEDKEVDAAHHGEEASSVHHERVEPGVSYAAAVRGDGPVWWT